MSKLVRFRKIFYYNGPKKFRLRILIKLDFFIHNNEQDNISFLRHDNRKMEPILCRVANFDSISLKLYCIKDEINLLFNLSNFY